MHLLDAVRINYALWKIGALRARKIPTYTRKLELYGLFNVAAQCPQGTQALEIGSYLGASTCYLVAALAQKNGHLFCVDTWQNETMPEGVQDTFELFVRNAQGIRRWITILRKRSDELGPSDIRIPLGLVFIDGDHSYEAVRRDFGLVSEWLDRAGLIAFHDCCSFKGVSRVVGEALASGEWALAGQINNLCFLKRAQYLLD